MKTLINMSVTLLSVATLFVGGIELLSGNAQFAQVASVFAIAIKVVLTVK